MQNKDEIRTTIIPILKKYGVQKTALFGSFVRGEQTEGSDIDLLVNFKDRENKSLLDLIGLEQELEETLHCKVDVLTYQSVNHRLKRYILEEQEIIYEEESEGIS